MGIFNKKAKEVLENTEIERLKKQIIRLQESLEEVNQQHEKNIENIKKDNDIILARKDAEVDVLVAEKTKELTAEVAKLKLQNGNYQKEVEILTKAFENLGFDVKDMKEILNKLVDGIVSKNTIQLVK